MPSMVLTRTPSLLPDFNTPVVGQPPSEIRMDDNLGQIQSEPFYASSVPGSGLATITTAAATNDPVVITVGAFGSITVITSAANTTVTQQAAALVKAINNSALGQVVFAANTAGAITLTAVHPGPASNLKYTFTTGGTAVGRFTSTNNATPTATVTDQMAGGTGNIVTPLEDFTFVTGRETIAVRRGRPFVTDAATATALINSGKLVS